MTITPRGIKCSASGSNSDSSVLTSVHFTNCSSTDSRLRIHFSLTEYLSPDHAAYLSIADTCTVLQLIHKPFQLSQIQIQRQATPVGYIL